MSTAYVAAALEQLAGRLEQGRDVALDELVLQREGRRRHDHAVAVQQRGHEVAERLAGAGAGLDEQVLLVVHRRGHGLGHRDLARPLLAAELLDGRPSTSRTARLLDHPSTLCGGSDTARGAGLLDGCAGEHHALGVR